MKVYAGLDPEPQDKKPEKWKIVDCKRRAVGNWKEIDLKELAELVGKKGCAMVPGHLVDGMKAEHCMEMQLFALDFDGGVSFEEIKSRCEYMDIPIAFAYHTFSSTPQKEKFRVVFAHDILIDDVFIIQIVIAMLHRIFPECDASCKNLDRIYLGGKELICCHDKARICLVQVYSVFYKQLDRNRNLGRDMRSFCNKHHILMVNGSAAMGDQVSGDFIMSQIDENTVSTSYHMIADTVDSSFFVIETLNLHQTVTCWEKIKSKRVDLEDEEACQLFRDFKNGVILDHDSRFMILTNMNGISGGVKEFFTILDQYYDEESCKKWRQDYKRDIKNYQPARCRKEVCPYYEECENRGTIVEAFSRARKVYQKKETYVTLEEASACLEENLEQALADSRNGFHLIKAQTGLGKTRMYINWIMEHPQVKVLVAVPTNPLKKQVGSDLRSSGIPEEDLFVTPSAQGDNFIPEELQDKISYYHEAGLHNQTKKLIDSFYQQIKEDPSKPAVAELCERLMLGAQAMEGKRVVVTTHAYLFQIPPEILNQYTVIIDEDILYLQVLSDSHCVSMGTVEQLYEKKVPGLSVIAGNILASEEGKYVRTEPLIGAQPLTEEQLNEYGIGCNRENNVNDLLYAGAYVRQNDRYAGEIVRYFCPKKLQPGKYIVLSATLSENIYREYGKGTMRVFSYREKKAAYKGKLKQYSYHSLGWKDLKKKTEIFDLARELSGDRELPILTFKNFKEEAGESCKGLHFGNLTGINSLKGCNIGIIGTPYKSEEAYKLPACYLGADVNEKPDIDPKYRRVEYKGNRFLVMTYQNELLRELQMYSLESELEQAVGRARLLRNHSTVYLFSSFPCEQAQIYGRNYLTDPPEKEESIREPARQSVKKRKLSPLSLEEVRRRRAGIQNPVPFPVYAC